MSRMSDKESKSKSDLNWTQEPTNITTFLLIKLNGKIVTLFIILEVSQTKKFNQVEEEVDWQSPGGEDVDKCLS